MIVHNPTRAGLIGAVKRETKPAQVRRQPEFTQAELLAMHRYCLKFRDLVRRGDIPTQEQLDRFMRFQRVTYGEGVAGGN
jgi:hypothetical protein